LLLAAVDTLRMLSSFLPSFSVIDGICYCQCCTPGAGGIRTI
jgi:hypothetical protein